MDESSEKVDKSTLMVRSQFKTQGQWGPVAEGDEEIAVHRFVVPPATVGVSLGLTLNIGNYESARIEVSVTIPCYKEEVEEAYTFARHMCGTRLEEEVKSVRTNGKPVPF